MFRLAIAILLIPWAAYADWDVDVRNGQLLAVGAATTDANTSSFVFLECEGSSIIFTVMSPNTVSEDDLAEYDQTPVIINYGTGTSAKTLKLLSRPKRNAGMTLMLSATLTPGDSTNLMAWLAAGHRIDIQLLHPDFDGSESKMKVYATGALDFAFALRKYCSNVKLDQ